MTHFEEHAKDEQVQKDGIHHEEQAHASMAQHQAREHVQRTFERVELRHGARLFASAEGFEWVH